MPGLTNSVTEPIRRATFGDQLRRHAARIPDRPAIIALHSPLHERRVLTYRELNEQANRLANSLAAQGVGLGDVVATMGLAGAFETYTSYAFYCVILVRLYLVGRLVQHLRILPDYPCFCSELEFFFPVNFRLH